MQNPQYNSVIVIKGLKKYRDTPDVTSKLQKIK